MSRHVIIPPRGDRTPAQPASKEEAVAVGIPIAPTPGAAATSVTEEGIERIPVAKGTSVTIGGKEYVAQSDAGVTVRKFKHSQGGQNTSVTIIDAPTREAVAFAAHLVETGQMLSEDEIKTLRKKGLLKDGQAVEPRVHRALLSQAHREAEWLAHQKKMEDKIGRLEAQLRAAGLEPEMTAVGPAPFEEDVEVATVGSKGK
jgi:hypothetical protein